MIAMEYFRITDDIYANDRWQLGEISGDSGPIDASRFTSAERYDSTEPLSIIVDDGHSLDFTLADFDVPIVSSFMASILQRKAASEVQLIPVVIKGAKPSNSEWFILNVLRKVDCLDEASSEILKWTSKDGRPDKVGEFRMVSKLVIAPSQINNSFIFRIDGWDVCIVVSGELRHQCEKAGLNGLVFENIT